MDRPALHRLLEDVRAGRVDAVLVYKVDRLTRALADFARIVAIFEAAQVAFVSVTQAFDTRSPMGKLTLNVLLSFSQFERELAAERIRDKIAASKARGLWMGGMVPIGYRAEARTLTAVPDEAALVRRIFERYLALGSVNRLKAELDAAGIRTPERLHRNGRRSGGAAFSRGKLYGMLANPVFIGRIRHRDLVHPGQHAAIVDPGLWQAVQDRLAANRVSRSLRQAARAPSPLAGRLLDPEGRKMRPSHAKSNGRRYRYYVSADLVEGSVATGATGWRIPAAEIEAAVARTLAARLRDPGFLSDALGHALVTLRRHPRLRPGSLPASPSWPTGSMRRDRQRGGKRSGGSSPGSSSRRPGSGRKRASPRRMRRPMAPTVRPWPALPPFAVTAPLQLQRRGPELRLVLQGAAAPAPRPDPLLVRTLIAARSRVADWLDPAQALSVSAIARRDGVDVGDVSRSLQLAFLAPDLVEGILDGTQPLALTAERLKRLGDLPLIWDAQRALLG